VTALQLARSPATLLPFDAEAVGAGLLTAAVGILLLAFGPAPGDAEVHLYRTFLVEHGARVWDNFWFAGDFPLASYSLLYYAPAALVGNVPLVLGAAIASTVLFSSIARREWGAVAVWPARIFGIFAAAPLFTGLYSYALGFAALLGAVFAAQRRRPLLGLALAAATLGFSPLAFGFLCLVFASVLVARRPLARQAAILAGGVGALALVELVVAREFPNGGPYPFHLVNLAGVVAVCGAGLALAQRTPAATQLGALFALWGATSIVLWAIPSPIGGNWTRLDEVVFPVMLLTAGLAGFRPRRLVLVALVGALAYDLAPPLLLVPYRLDARPATEQFWQPAIEYLARHSRPGFRVEVVPTAAHWESYWIPRSGLPLARGFFRQLDVADNPVLYSTSLDAASYAAWLRSLAVEYVLLPATRLDPVAAPREAALLRSGVPDMRRVFQGRTGTIYELARPTPLVTGPGRSRVLVFGHTRIAGVVSAPGRYVLRVHFNPFWQTTAGVCVSRAPDGLSYLDLARAGRYLLRVSAAGQALVRAIAGDSPCKAAA
jgi:hypothetical protein